MKKFYFSDADQELHDEYLKRFTAEVAKQHGEVTKEHSILLEVLAHAVVQYYRRQRMENIYGRGQVRSMPKDPIVQILELAKKLGLTKGSE